jgi:hypothetical protein
MQAADQAETCRQLTEANSSLRARVLNLTEEATSAPEKVHEQPEGQLAECTKVLRKVREEVVGMRMSEQTQRIVLLDELNHHFRIHLMRMNERTDFRCKVVFVRLRVFAKQSESFNQ